MQREHKRTEQVYLAFHDWRARLDTELDRLDTDYLQSLCTDMQRALAHIERELATRAAAARRDTPDITTAQPYN